MSGAEIALIDHFRRDIITVMPRRLSTYRNMPAGPLCVAALLLVAVAFGCQQANRLPMDVARHHFTRGQWDEAIKACDEALKEDSQSVEALILRGRSHLGKGQPQLAVADYTRAIALAPDDPEAFHHRAIAYDQLGAADEAEADKTAARRRDPYYKNVYAHRDSPYELPLLSAETSPSPDGQVTGEESSENQTAPAEWPPSKERSDSNDIAGSTKTHTEEILEDDLLAADADDDIGSPSSGLPRSTSVTESILELNSGQGPVAAGDLSPAGRSLSLSEWIGGNSDNGPRPPGIAPISPVPSDPSGVSNSAGAERPTTFQPYSAGQRRWPGNFNAQPSRYVGPYPAPADNSFAPAAGVVGDPSSQSSSGPATYTPYPQVPRTTGIIGGYGN